MGEKGVAVSVSSDPFDSCMIGFSGGCYSVSNFSQFCAVFCLAISSRKEENFSNRIETDNADCKPHFSQHQQFSNSSFFRFNCEFNNSTIMRARRGLWSLHFPKKNLKVSGTELGFLEIRYGSTADDLIGNEHFEFMALPPTLLFPPNKNGLSHFQAHDTMGFLFQPTAYLTSPIQIYLNFPPFLSWCPIRLHSLEQVGHSSCIVDALCMSSST